jgi:hypothetical protein
MQEQINIKPHASLKQVHVLVIRELRSQEAVHGDLGARTWDLNASFASFDEEDTDRVARDSEVDLVPFAFAVSFPRDQHTLVAQSPRRILEGSKLGFPARALKFSFVVVLFGEGHEEAFLPVGLSVCVRLPRRWTYPFFCRVIMACSI